MPTTTITDVRTVALNVADQDRAVDFYVNTLGFEKRLDAPIGPGMRWIEVAAPGASVSLAVTAAAPDAPAADTGIRLTTTDAELEHTTLRARGVDVDELLRWPDVPAMFSFHDPDGNTLYVVEAPPGGGE